MDSLETQINNHPIFSVDKEKDGELYIIEERKFLEILMEYLKPRKDFREFGWVFFEKAKNCLKSYKTEKGKFLNYYESSLKKELYKEKSKEWKEKAQCGMTHTGEEKLEFLKDKYFEIIQEENQEESENDRLGKYFKSVEIAFGKYKGEKKPILRDLLTIKYADIKDSELIKYNFNFINKGILEQKTLPQQKDIAEKFKVSPENANLILKRFLEKVK